MNPAEVWELLGIAPTNDERVIKKAYAAKVRVFRPDTHPQEFSQLRQAYELALRLRHVVEVSPHPVPQGQLPPGLPDLLVEQASAPAPLVGEPVVQQVEPAQARQTSPPSESVDLAPADPDSQTSPLPRQDQPEVQPAGQSEAHTMLDGLASHYREHGEAAAVDMLHQQIHALVQKSIDTRLDYEGMLLSALLNQERPLLRLTFEAARRFQWASHMHDVVQQVGEQGARRLALLMDFSNRAVFAGNFSSNRWIKRLHGDSTRLPHWGNLSQVRSAQDAAFGWFAWCDDAGIPDLKYALNLPVLERMEKLILTTDIWFALLVAWLFNLLGTDLLDLTDPELAKMGIFVAIACALPIPFLWRRLQAQAWMPERFHRRAWGSPEPNAEMQRKVGMLFIGLFTLAFASPVLIIQDMPPVVRAVGHSILAGVGILIALALLGAAWRLIHSIENTITAGFFKLCNAVDIYLFEQVLHSKNAAWPDHGGKQRFKNIPKVWWAERKKAKLRRQEQAAQSSTPYSWSWLWFPALMLLMAFLRSIISNGNI